MQCVKEKALLSVGHGTRQSNDGAMDSEGLITTGASHLLAHHHLSLNAKQVPSASTEWQRAVVLASSTSAAAVPSSAQE